ncbi:MAG: hypothetical protein JW709_05120 [Sedimentisphaerales bacterium]|nr:hypothetical protein [Sedimentisphaerales bacterium]
MNDTTSDMEKRMAAMMAARSPAERLRMASDMFDAGRELLRAGLKNHNPLITEDQLRTQVFLRLYGDDFSPEEIRRIASCLPNMQLT